jgi:prepilin-type N-terminal cleavage/methylation domain-containing protein
MIKTIRRPQAGFTLIELLTVIAIIGILASIIIPTVGKVQQTARRTADSSNLRQIGQASLIFAQSSKDQLPSSKLGSGSSFGQNSTTGQNATVKLIAGALAVNAGLDTAAMWVSRADDTTSAETANSSVSSVLNKSKDNLDANFQNANLAFGYVAGLTTNYPATTPVAFTRGIVSSGDGKWSETNGTYKNDGGHVVFIGGNLAFYKNLGATKANGELINSDGSPTNQIKDTVKTNKINVKFLEEDSNGSALSGISPTGS